MAETEPTFPHSPTSKYLIAPCSPVEFAPSSPPGTELRALRASLHFSSFLSRSPCMYSVFQPICSPLFPENTLYLLSRCLCSFSSFHLQRTFTFCQNSAKSSGLLVPMLLPPFPPAKCFWMLGRGCELSPFSTTW